MLPLGREVITALGGSVLVIVPLLQLVSVVRIPAISNALAINPTDCEQRGQDGTSRAAVTLFAVARSNIAGIVSVIMRFTSG